MNMPTQPEGWTGLKQDQCSLSLERYEKAEDIIRLWRGRSTDLSPEDYKIHGVKVMRMFFEILAGTRDFDQAHEEISEWF